MVGIFFLLLDTDDSIPMTFEDVDDVSLAAEFYMFSSQVDGEQDLVVPAPKPGLVSTAHFLNGVNNMVNSDSQQQASTVKTERPASQVLVNGSSILARQLSFGVINNKVNGSLDSGIDNMYSCDICSAKLKNKRNFETHMKRHRGELPFKCDECPKTFQGRRDLETHKRSRHDQIRRGTLNTDIGLMLSKSSVIPDSNSTALNTSSLIFNSPASSSLVLSTASTVFTTVAATISSTPSTSFSSCTTDTTAKTVVLSLNGFSPGFISGNL